MDRPNSNSSVDTIQRSQSRSASHRDFAAMLTSAGLHATFLMVLALWVLPIYSSQKQTLLVSVGDHLPLALESLDLSSVVVPEMLDSTEKATDEVNVFEATVMELEFETSENQNTDIDWAASFVPSTVIEESLSTSASVEGAVDRITAELNAKLEKGDLLVVWLLDSSNSLVDDRQRVAARLAPFYQGLVSGRNSSKHELASSVVSYGKAMRERVAPSRFGKEIIDAVEQLPVDRSGDEKVFDAVVKCAENYRKSWPDRQIVVVIWTDESGDDPVNLDRAISTCRRLGVSVSVVGPSSVLGADTGLHSYTDPRTESVYQLPVRRGPDSAMPERPELGYWFITRGPPGSSGSFRGRVRRWSLPSWLGGQDLEGILSGFSPYALTRLTMQTGGSYTIFDRPEDRGPFDLETMIRYAPSYGSFADYKADIQANPLRQAILKSVDELKGKQVDSPPTMLFTKITGPRFFDFMRYYYPPMEFQSKLRSSRNRLTGQASRYSKVVEAALRHLSSDASLKEGLEDLYRYEPSPRWRAWYDLTRGRLLATSVRLEEYRLAVTAISQPGSLAAGTNHVILVASPEKRSDSTHYARGKEAEFLLRRCVEQHRGTPWEVLAQRELDFALGIAVQQRSLTPGPSATVRQPNLPRF